jgi:MFS family permease
MHTLSSPAQEPAIPEQERLSSKEASQKTPANQSVRHAHAFSALRHRNFRLFWSGQMISLVGTWMQTTGQAWLVLKLTGSAWQLGLVGALQFLPVLLFSLFGGVFADRWPKRNVLLFTQAVSMIQATILCLLVVSNHVQIWEIYVLALLLGATNSLDMPTRQAFVAEMVGREDLANAVALNSSIFNLARIVGPGIAGLIIAISNVTTLFLLNAVSFIAVLAGLALIDLHQLREQTAPHSDTEQGKTWLRLREGLAYIRQTPAVLMVISVVGAVSLFGINFNVVLPLFADEVLHSGAIGFGFLSSAFGIGSLISALWLAWGNRRASITRILVGTSLFSLLLIGFAISPGYVLSLVLIAAVGFAQIAFSALSNTMLQTVTPNHLRGRVMSVYTLVFIGSNPIGNLLIGGLAGWVGAPLALLICAMLSLISALAGWIWRKPAEKNLELSTTAF